VLFQHLDDEQKNDIVDEMFRVEVTKDTTIIRQGDTVRFFATLFFSRELSFKILFELCEEGV
jgi:hypothetical protein